VPRTVSETMFARTSLSEGAVFFQRSGACIVLVTVISCGGHATNATDGALFTDAATSDVEDAAIADASLDSLSTDGDAAVGGTIPVIVGSMAFNEPLNDHFSRDFTPTWHSDDLKISSAGLISANVTTIFAGDQTSVQEHRDVLFWNVTGMVASGGDWLQISLSETLGTIPSAVGDTSVVFTVDGSFQLMPQELGSGMLSKILVGFTWVRAYRAADGGTSYQVFPGDRSAFYTPSPVGWDQVASLEGQFEYYGALMDSPSLGGGDFDYPSWITTHVVW
jgi:hypothetical protein